MGCLRQSAAVHDAHGRPSHRRPHAIIAFTPLYDFIARHLIGAPEAIIEPGRIGLMIMMPWSWAIAYRRTQQGLMIRFGHPKAVGVGTIIRMSANGIVLLAGYLIHSLPGIVVASSAVAVGVIAEAIYAGLRVRPIIRQQLRLAPRAETPLTLRDFLTFYIPLAMTALISLLVQPIGSATMSRLPRALDSLAVWPVLSGLLFMLRSGGIAYKEAVISLLDDPHAARNLRRFTALLAAGGTALLLLITVTPLSALWFGRVMALSPALMDLGVPGLDRRPVLSGDCHARQLVSGVADAPPSHTQHHRRRRAVHRGHRRRYGRGDRPRPPGHPRRRRVRGASSSSRLPGRCKWGGCGGGAERWKFQVKG